MLFGSMSKKREEPLLPSTKPPCAFVSLLKGTPSTINKGWFPWLKVLNPRITILVPDPDKPLWLVICTPEALPVKIRPISPSPLCSRASDSTSETAYPSACFSRLIPREVTITSSSWFPWARLMLTTSSAPTVTAVVSYPTKLNSRTFPSATSMLKFPSKSVETPFDVPCSRTVAPGSGIPWSSVTVPVMVFCAIANCNESKENTNSLLKLFIL